MTVTARTAGLVVAALLALVLLVGLVARQSPSAGSPQAGLIWDGGGAAATGAPLAAG